MALETARRKLKAANPQGGSLGSTATPAIVAATMTATKPAKLPHCFVFHDPAVQPVDVRAAESGQGADCRAQGGSPAGQTLKIGKSLLPSQALALAALKDGELRKKTRLTMARKSSAASQASKASRAFVKICAGACLDVCARACLRAKGVVRRRVGKKRVRKRSGLRGLGDGRGRGWEGGSGHEMRSGCIRSLSSPRAGSTSALSRRSCACPAWGS